MRSRSKRKRRTSGSSSHYVAEDGEESMERKYGATCESRTDCEEPLILISDSDDEAEEEESILSRKTVRPPPHRKTLAAKRKIANMTEEEQLALAVKISQQEQANHVIYKEEESEDELLKKAIQHSLHSCRIPDVSPHDTAPKLTNETHSCKEVIGSQEHNEELPLSQCSRRSDEHSQKSPVVLLKRLSQDIVESSSVILSPNLKCPISYIENCKEYPLSPSSSTDFVKSQCKTVPVSPVFSLKSPFKQRMLPCRLFPDNSPSTKSLQSEIDDQRSHCSESSQLDSMSLLPASESELSSVPQNKETCDENLSSENATTSGKGDMASVCGHKDYFCNANMEPKNQDSLHYYWGVPFCPKGVDPSTYTQVILCQLEVYQKSLKRAQRNLLHKMDYGQPIQLSGSCQKSNKQAKGNLSQEEDTEEIIDDCETQKPVETEQEQSNDSHCSKTQNVLCKRQKVSPSPVPKSQGGDQSQYSSQGLFTKVLPGECGGVSPRALGESAVSPTVLRSHRHLMEHTEGTLNDEITICPETQPSPDRQEDLDKEDDPYLIEASTEQLSPIIQPTKHQKPKKPAKIEASLSNGSTVEDIECLEQTRPNNVECPMCGCTFSRSQIERHAAYCDGINSQQEMAALRPRHSNKKSNSLRNHTVSEDSMLPADSGKYEKCYLCKSLVSIRDYQGHVDNCLQTAVFETEVSPRLRSNRGSAGRDGRLLRMLEKSESTSDARNCSRQGLSRCSSSNSNPNCLVLSSSKEGNHNVRDFSYMSPPREQQDLNVSSELLSISDSPIRSFVSISEAKDCLVDFKKQFRRQPSNKGSSRRGKRKRM